MKKLMMVAAVALMLVGCGKESKLESLIREAGEIAGESQAEIDKEVDKALKEFREMSSEEQEQALKAAEAMVEMAKSVKKLEGAFK